MPRKPGNHGRFIPRDRRRLRSLYWTQQKTLPEIAAMFDVTHKSVLRVFRQLGIPTRRKGQKPIRGCVVCGAKVFKIKHAGNGAMYGRRCKRHWNEHRAKLAAEECKRPEVRERRRKELRRWYYHGPINLKGERAWLSKGKSLLRTAKRYLAKPETREAFRRQIAESAPDRTLHT